jgi:hypothetical protein
MRQTLDDSREEWFEAAKAVHAAVVGIIVCLGGGGDEDWCGIMTTKVLSYQ